MLINHAWSQDVYKSSFRPPDRDFMLYRKQDNLQFKKVYRNNCYSVSFSRDSCKCDLYREYDNEGHLLKLISGSDIRKDSVDYIINTIKYSDTASLIRLELMSSYFDKNMVWAYSNEYDITSVNALIKYNQFDTIPSKVIYNDTLGKELSVYYPEPKEKTIFNSDTLTLELGKIVLTEENTIDNSSCAILKYNNYNILLESVFIIKGGSWVSDQFIRQHYYYDSSNRLLKTVTKDEYNRINGISEIQYNENKIIKETQYCDSTGKNCLDELYYNSDGDLIERRDNWFSEKYFYDKRRLEKILYFENNHFKRAVIYQYD